MRDEGEGLRKFVIIVIIIHGGSPEMGSVCTVLAVFYILRICICIAHHAVCEFVNKILYIPLPW